MKPFLLALACLACFSAPAIAQLSCFSYKYQQELAKDPSQLRSFQQAESFSQNLLGREFISGAPTGANGSVNLIRIPVVFHIVYNTSEQNISDDQVRSQIDILNKEFRKVHADTGRIPSAFRELAADTYIEFVLARINPQGYATSGILRKKTSASGFVNDDKVKFSGSGGDDAWDSDRYLNIWVCRTTMGIYGYSSAPGGPKPKDGIVLNYTAIGNMGTATAPYNKGRTAVHEVGHWLGLRHIWGDYYCGDDGIDDTPKQGTPTQGCPSGSLFSCNNSTVAIMYNNYMDLTSDACTNMFTVGQVAKMRSQFAAGGPRFPLLSSNGATGIPLPDAEPAPDVEEPSIRIFPNPAANFISINIGAQEALIGKSVTLHNQFGQQVIRKLIAGTVTVLPVSSFKNGVYYIKIGESAKVYKIVKG